MDPSRVISYDEVLQYLADIESGVLESRCNNKDLEHINAWLVYLARAGVIPGDAEAESLLEIDIEELESEGSSFEFGSYYDGDAQFLLIPTITAGGFEAFVCKGWLSKKWKQTKKEIFIGAAGSTAAGDCAGSAGHYKTGINPNEITAQTEQIKKDILLKDLHSLKIHTLQSKKTRD